MDFRRKNIDLVGRMRLWFGISLAVLAVGLISWAAFGLNLGIDFQGGSQFTYRIPDAARPAAGQEVTLLAKVNQGLEAAKLNGTRTQIAGGQDLVVNTPALTDSEANAQARVVNEAVAKAFGVEKITPEGRQQVGAVIGDELRANAIKGVVFGVLAIALWIYIRYNFAGDGTRFAVAGIVALVHDVLVLLGIFALIGRIDPRIEIDGAFIAALLTVVGYSINDSVVIFDRLRENLRNRRKEPFEKVVNDSLLETMSRSINTGLTVLIMLFVLLMFGGESIYNFTLAMLIGIASGLYSSIFNASMVLVAWHRWDEKKAARAKANRASVSVRETARSGALKPRAK
ncbi:MAG: protein translocase subunit SecF [Armatimonadetes bacterium]|nr:protein translocase subunit SecF [Armatimonadota bacterium]